MGVLYYIRHFNGDGGVLRFAMVHCASDIEAIRRAASEPPPPGCGTVEVAREETFIWRASAAELWSIPNRDSRPSAAANGETAQPGI